MRAEKVFVVFTKNQRELKRWYFRFDRLIERANRLLEGLSNSSLTLEEKKEILKFYETFSEEYMKEFLEKLSPH